MSQVPAELVFRAPVADDLSQRLLDRLLSGSHLVNGRVTLLRCPSDVERRQLTVRRKAIIESSGHDKGVIKGAVHAMLKGFRSAIKANESASEVVGWYVNELGLKPAVPTWAVLRACSEIRLGAAVLDGERIDLNFPMSTAILRRLCDQHVAPWRRELIRINDALNGEAPPRQLSPEERAYIGQGFAQLSAELRRDEASAIVSRAAAEQDLRERFGDAAVDSLPDQPPPKPKPASEAASKVAATAKRAMEESDWPLGLP